jgi:hypothetical protein
MLDTQQAWKALFEIPGHLLLRQYDTITHKLTIFNNSQQIKIDEILPPCLIAATKARLSQIQTARLHRDDKRKKVMTVPRDYITLFFGLETSNNKYTNP